MIELQNALAAAVTGRPYALLTQIHAAAAAVGEGAAGR